MKDKILLHVCCGPCATHSIKSLMDEYDVTCFFYNPCIEPEEEYERRKDAFIKVCEKLSVGFVIPTYDNGSFRKVVSGLENEPENGLRCIKCYEQRIRESARYAKENGFYIFTTTLTISPHKNSKVIFDIGRKASADNGVHFLEKDFKKQDGFKCSVEMSKELLIYRQNYCGCEFSKR